MTGPGDFNGDNKVDVLAVDRKGTLWLYPGHGAGGLLTRVKVSPDWDKIELMTGPGDFNGDDQVLFWSVTVQILSL